MFFACLLVAAAVPAGANSPIILKGADGVEAVFEARDGRYRWSSYRDTRAGKEWPITGALFSVQTEDGFRVNLGDVGCAVPDDAPPTQTAVTLEATLPHPAVTVRQVFTFCPDGRTLRVRTSLRAIDEPVTIQRVGLLEIRLPGQVIQRMGEEHVSCPMVTDRTYAGVEHPSVLCQVVDDTMYLAQHLDLRVGTEWVQVPSAVFGAASDADMARGQDAVRRAFIRYLDTVRLKLSDLHVHYNDWWTTPRPLSEESVLDNIAALKAGLYDTTGFFFDSYAVDLGWSDPHSVWEINREIFPRGFGRIRRTLGQMGCRLGLWVSPSSMYPSALDNAWLEQAGYEVSPDPYLGRFACLAIGGRYQQAFKSALLRHARNAHLGHVKFDGLSWPCTAESHGHKPGLESFRLIAEGLADVFDALRQQDPTIVLEPTCLGYYPSPWWLMHTPVVLGPFGNDLPLGVCPSPEGIESLTTGRDVEILKGRHAFWMPSSALECFDIVVQCPGDMRNHFVMAVARGHWFQSTYINPKVMDEGQWRFFADLMRWAREHREQLQEPLVFGGDPANCEAYGYAYVEGERQLYFVRNPWIEPATLALPEPLVRGARELRMLYPCPELVCRVAEGASLPQVTLGPYELVVLEATPTKQRPRAPATLPEPPVQWTPDGPPLCERRRYSAGAPAFGPSWTSLEGDLEETLTIRGAGVLTAKTAAELCVLVGAPPNVPANCVVTLNEKPIALRTTGSPGSFYASGTPPAEGWQWFLAPIPRGRHRLSFEITLPEESVRCGLFVRGTRRAREQLAAPSTQGRPFPLPPHPGRPWARTLMPVTAPDELGIVERSVERTIITIDGVFLDSLDWVEASAGWGQVQRNRSVMGAPMVMGGRVYLRGIGTHAYSRIVYELPEGFSRFAATIGCDQEVHGNSVVFVVQGDGRELFRSPLMRRDTPPKDISVPIRGVKRLTLVLEDGGDGIAADHGNWADARLLR